MHEEQFQYGGVASSAAGIGFVGINLQRGDGSEFVVILSTEEAERLCDDLPEQIRISKRR